MNLNPRSIVAVVLALVCGASAAMGMVRLGTAAAKSVEVETVPVVTATSDVPRGQMLTSKMLAVREWPKQFVPDTALKSLEEAADRATLAPLVSGEPVLEAKLAAKDAGRGLAVLIPQGKRAYTIQTPRAAANVAGFILPGNRVDVLMSLHGNPNDETGGGSTTTLLQAVEILAVDQRLDAPAENKTDPSELRSVTLIVTAEQAALLDLGQNLGMLTLSLRNPEDTAEAQTLPATLAQIRFHQEKPADSADPTAGGPPSAPGPSGSRASRQFEIRTLRGTYTGQIVLVEKQP